MEHLLGPRHRCGNELWKYVKVVTRGRIKPYIFRNCYIPGPEVRFIKQLNRSEAERGKTIKQRQCSGQFHQRAQHFVVQKKWVHMGGHEKSLGADMTKTQFSWLGSPDQITFEKVIWSEIFRSFSQWSFRSRSHSFAHFYPLGIYIDDVCTGGVAQKVMGCCVDLISTADHHQMRTRGEGSKIPKILRTYLVEAPYVG